MVELALTQRPSPPLQAVTAPLQCEDTCSGWAQVRHSTCPSFVQVQTFVSGAFDFPEQEKVRLEKDIDTNVEILTHFLQEPLT